MDGSTFFGGEEPFLPFNPSIEAFGAPARPRRGIVAGTLIATENGWRPVEQLAPGDKVQTFDNGMQIISDISAETLWDEGTVSLNDPLPVVMPAGALGNSQPIILLPHQGVLLESENACDAMGDPLAVVPSRVLVGINGIDTAPPRCDLVVYTLTFACDEVVYADGGLLLHCPNEAMPADLLEESRLYDVKNLVEARQMLTDLDIAQLVLDDQSLDEFEDAALERVA